MELTQDMRLLLALGAVALLAGCGGGTTTVTVTTTHTVTRTVATPPTTTTPSAPACTGSDLHGSFDVQQGSAGAGNIVYTLVLTSGSSSSCFVSGIPELRLLDKNGAPLPTKQSAAQPGTQTAVRVVLAPSASATADARFSPDVAGPGESQTGACEPTAVTLRVTLPAGGSVDAAIHPPTPVCEHGSLQMRNLAAA